MIGNPLLDGYLAELSSRLPADVVAELADGLTDTYQHHLATAANPQAAARRAITEFGTVDDITSAFTVGSPSRRTARRLLATGPLVGGAWAGAILLSRTGQWTVPVPVRLAFGLSVLAVVATLAIAATSRRHYNRAHTTALAGSIGILALDTSACLAATLTTTALAGPLAFAAAASLTRIATTLRTLPQLVAG